MRIAVLAAVSALAMVSAAQAADVITEQAPAPAPVVETFSWTGPYLGVFGALGGGDSDFDFDFFGASGGFSDTARGGFLGAQVGYDWQFNNFVLGAYADIALSNYEAELSGSVGVPFPVDFEVSSELKYLGTVQGRLGFAMDRALFYAHGGFAYGKTEQNVDISIAPGIDTDSGTKTGYVVGAGIEYAFTNHLSLQTEYSYVDLGKDNVFDEPGLSVDEDVQFHMIKAALNYRF